MANIYLTPNFVEQQRAQGKDDSVIADFIAMKTQDKEFQSGLSAAKSKFGNQAIGKYLDYKIYGTSNPTDRFVPEQESMEEQGFLSRLGSSLASVPERFQRGFGSQEVREGRQETSKGFDIADIPGDIADVAGAALPMFGGLVGGAAGTVLGPAGQIGGAAAGAGALEGGRQIIGDVLNVEERFGEGGPDRLDPRAITRETVAGGLGEAGGIVIGKLGGKLLRPFASRFNDDIARIAKRADIDMPASAVSDSAVVQQGEALASKGFFGGPIQKTYDDAVSKLARLSDDLVRSLNGTTDLATAGDSIVDGLAKYEEAWRAGKNELYDQASKQLNERVVVSSANKLIPDVDNTITLLDSLIADEKLASEVLGEGFDTSVLATMRNNLAEGKSFDAVKATIKELNKLGKFGGREVVATGDTAVFRKVAATLDEDIMNWLQDAAPDAYDAAVAADKFYAEGIEALNGKVGTAIGSLVDEPSKLVNKVIQPKSPEKVQKAFDLLISGDGGPQRVADVQSAFLQSLFVQARGATDDLTGKGLKRVINKYGDDTLKVVLGDDALKVLKEYSELADALAKSQRVAGGSQTAFLTEFGTTMMLLGSGQFKEAAALVGSDAILSQVFNSALGKKWLTEGLTAAPVFEESAGALTRLATQQATRIGFPEGESENDIK